MEWDGEVPKLEKGGRGIRRENKHIYFTFRCIFLFRFLMLRSILLDYHRSNIIINIVFKDADYEFPSDAINYYFYKNR